MSHTIRNTDEYRNLMHEPTHTLKKINSVPVIMTTLTAATYTHTQIAKL